MPDPFDPAADILAEAGPLADCALRVLARAHPHKLDHLILDDDDHRRPREMHPVFDGCFDWHSSVHMHWSLLRLRTLAPGRVPDDAIARRFDAHFRPELVATELAYVRTPGRGSFERPYGWAWLLRLQQELQAQAAQGRADAARWAAALQPLAQDLAARLQRFLALGGAPVRAGTHANSAFAMLLARDYATGTGDYSLRDQIDETARTWFGADVSYPARYEPSGTDFLSPGLVEAVLMREVLGEAHAAWWGAFRPQDDALQAWLQPATVLDRRDGQLVHMDGLNLSRAWCLRSLARSLPEVDAARLRQAARMHWQAAWPHVMGGDFVATHWLVSFALLS